MSIQEKNSAQHPAIFDNAALFDYSRFDVYNPAYQSLFARNKNYRPLTRRINIDHVDRDTTTGWREAEYDDTEIYGILVEQGGSIPRFVSGITMQLDAVLITFDGVNMNDQIKDGDKYFRVDEMEEHTDPYVQGPDDDTYRFAFRVCHLHKLQLYQHG